MGTDFSVRILPLVSLWAMMAASFFEDDPIYRIVFPTICLAVVAVAESFAYNWMIKEEPQSVWDRFTGFGFPTMSAFHYLLCSLKASEDDEGYVEVLFQRFRTAQRIRCFFSFVLSLVVLALAAMNLSDCSGNKCGHAAIAAVLMLFTYPALLWNYREMKWIGNPKNSVVSNPAPSSDGPSKTEPATSSETATNPDTTEEAGQEDTIMEQEQVQSDSEAE